MNIYLVPISEDDSLYIKRIVASSRKNAEEKLFTYFHDKYDWLEGDSLDEISEQLYDKYIDFGDIYESEEFTR